MKKWAPDSTKHLPPLQKENFGVDEKVVRRTWGETTRRLGESLANALQPNSSSPRR